MKVHNAVEDDRAAKKEQLFGRLGTIALVGGLVIVLVVILRQDYFEPTKI